MEHGAIYFVRLFRTIQTHMGIFDKGRTLALALLPENIVELAFLTHSVMEQYNWAFMTTKTPTRFDIFFRKSWLDFGNLDTKYCGVNTACYLLTINGSLTLFII